MLLIQILVIVGIISLCVAGVQYRGYLLASPSENKENDVIKKQYLLTTLFSFFSFIISGYVFYF